MHRIAVPDMPGVFVATVSFPAAVDPDQLTSAERALFGAFAADNHRRRTEWWSGRVAAHRALEACGLPNLSVLRDDDGRPRLEGPDAGRAQIAITHGKRRAAAVAVTAPAPWPHVGIDIVDPEDQPRLERIAERVLRGPEPELVAAGPADNLRIIWGTREAIAKATHTGMFVFALTKVWATQIDHGRRRVETNLDGVRVQWLAIADELLIVAGATDPAVRRAQAARLSGT